MAHTIKVDSGLCTGCHSCTEACSADVIRWDEAKNVPFAAYPDDCQVCCVCESVCPVQALLVVPDWTSKYSPPVMAGEKAEEYV